MATRKLTDWPMARYNADSITESARAIQRHLQAGKRANVLKDIQALEHYARTLRAVLETRPAKAEGRA